MLVARGIPSLLCVAFASIQIFGLRHHSLCCYCFNARSLDCSMV